MKVQQWDTSSYKFIDQYQIGHLAGRGVCDSNSLSCPTTQHNDHGLSQASLRAVRDEEHAVSTAWLGPWLFHPELHVLHF